MIYKRKLVVRSQRNWIARSGVINIDNKSFSNFIAEENTFSLFSFHFSNYLLKFLKFIFRHPILSIVICEIYSISKRIKGRVLILECGSAPFFSFIQPTIIYLEDPLGLFGWQPKEINKFNIAILSLRMKFSRFRGFIFMSKTSRLAAINIFGSQIINRYDLGIVYPTGLPKDNDNYNTLHSKQNDIVFGFCSIDPIGKGALELIEAMKKINKTAHLVVVVPKKFHNIFDPLKKHDIQLTIKTWGEIDICSDFFDKVDYVLSPTFMDSCPLLLVEAISRGVPFVAADVFAIKELSELCTNSIVIKRSLKFNYYDENGIATKNIPPLKFMANCSKYNEQKEYDNMFIEQFITVLNNLEKPEKVMSNDEIKMRLQLDNLKSIVNIALKK